MGSTSMVRVYEKPLPGRTDGCAIALSPLKYIGEDMPLFNFTDASFDPLALDETGHEEFWGMGPAKARFFRIACQGADPQELT